MENSNILDIENYAVYKSGVTETFSRWADWDIGTIQAEQTPLW